MIKDEASYIVEWLEYHLLVGVDKFFIYDNESKDNLKEVLAPYIKEGIVEYSFFPGKLQQIPIYNDAIKRYRFSSFWLAFIDVDEFIVPVVSKTIPDFLHEFEGKPGVEINWVLYGSGGHQKKTDGLVLEKFKCHDEWDSRYNHTVKSIVNPRCVFFMTAHIAEYIDGKKSVDSDKNENLMSGFERCALHDKIRINHYYSKSLEEFIVKMKKGRATSPGDIPIEEFYRRDRNEIKNDTIMDEYIPIVKERIKRRFSGNK
jgi:hypothetical protein